MEPGRGADGVGWVFVFQVGFDVVHPLVQLDQRFVRRLTMRVERL